MAFARRPAVLSIAACLAMIGVFLGRLLDPGVALATRDVALFHLPLRTALSHLLGWGLPEWNPWLNGGQPLLSNPSYSFFYPATWLELCFDSAYGLSLGVILHVAVAWAGAWRFARHLGCGRGGALLAALGFAAGGPLLSLLHALNLLPGLALLPWALLFGDRALRRPAGPGWTAPAACCAGVLALQLLNGELATTLVTVFALAGLTLDASLAGRDAAVRAVGRLGAALLLVVGLAAVQLVPTWARLADSPRAGGVELERATTWSASPARLVEIVWPRFFGDPAREGEGAYFGWGVHDQDFPYLLSPYPGTLLVLAGLVGLLRGPVPRRAAWLLLLGLGLFLALGRHNPLFAVAWHALPPLRLLRYPEKFLLLTSVALVFAGALTWNHLLAERERGRRGGVDLLLALALVLLAFSVTLAAALHLSRTLAAWWVATHSGLRPSAVVLAKGVELLRHESLVASLVALANAGLLWAMRFGESRRSTLAVLAVAVLGLDLWHYDAGLVQVVPASLYQAKPPLAAAIPSPLDRVFTTVGLDPRPEVYPRGADGQSTLTRTRLRRLDPYSGLLWDLSYAYGTDYDLMLTSWAERGARALRDDWADQDLTGRALGAWNVGTIIVRRGPSELARDVLAGELEPAPAELRPNPYRLPRYRLVPEAEQHADREGALAAARHERYAVAKREHLVAAGSPGLRRFAVDAVLGPIEERGGRIHLTYRSRTPTLLVAAMTFDDGWTASLAGVPLRTWPTALGQVAVELPAGAGQVELVFRDPWLRVGAALSAITLLALLVAVGRGGQRGAAALATREPLQSPTP